MLTFKELTERLAPKQLYPLYTAWNVMQNAGVFVWFGSKYYTVTHTASERVFSKLQAQYFPSSNMLLYEM